MADDWMEASKKGYDKAVNATGALTRQQIIDKAIADRIKEDARKQGEADKLTAAKVRVLKESLDENNIPYNKSTDGKTVEIPNNFKDRDIGKVVASNVAATLNAEVKGVATVDDKGSIVIDGEKLSKLPAYVRDEIQKKIGGAKAFEAKREEYLATSKPKAPEKVKIDGTYPLDEAQVYAAELNKANPANKIELVQDGKGNARMEGAKQPSWEDFAAADEVLSAFMAKKQNLPAPTLADDVRLKTLVIAEPELVALEPEPVKAPEAPKLDPVAEALARLTPAALDRGISERMIREPLPTAAELASPVVIAEQDKRPPTSAKKLTEDVIATTTDGILPSLPGDTTRVTGGDGVNVIPSYDPDSPAPGNRDAALWSGGSSSMPNDKPAASAPGDRNAALWSGSDSSMPSDKPTASVSEDRDAASWSGGSLSMPNDKPVASTPRDRDAALWSGGDSAMPSNKSAVSASGDRDAALWSGADSPMPAEPKINEDLLKTRLATFNEALEAVNVVKISMTSSEALSQLAGQGEKLGGSFIAQSAVLQVNQDIRADLAVENGRLVDPIRDQDDRMYYNDARNAEALKKGVNVVGDANDRIAFDTNGMGNEATINFNNTSGKAKIDIVVSKGAEVTLLESKDNTVKLLVSEEGQEAKTITINGASQKDIQVAEINRTINKASTFVDLDKLENTKKDSNDKAKFLTNLANNNLEKAANDLAGTFDANNNGKLDENELQLALGAFKKDPKLAGVKITNVDLMAVGSALKAAGMGEATAVSTQQPLAPMNVAGNNRSDAPSQKGPTMP